MEPQVFKSGKVDRDIATAGVSGEAAMGGGLCVDHVFESLLQVSRVHNMVRATLMALGHQQEPPPIDSRP
jgi:hypothetical protein